MKTIPSEAYELHTMNYQVDSSKDRYKLAAALLCIAFATLLFVELLGFGVTGVQISSIVVINVANPAPSPSGSNITYRSDDNSLDNRFNWTELIDSVQLLKDIEVDLLKQSMAYTSTSFGSYLTSKNAGKSRIDAWSCGLCKLGVTLVQTLVKNNSSKQQIVEKLTSFCVTFHIQDRRVCKGIVRGFQVEVLYVFTHLALNPDEVCGYFIGDSCSSVYSPFDMWNITLPATPKPPVVPPKPPKPGAHRVRILQLSDTHVDFDYTIGANAECTEPVCCHPDDYKIAKSDLKAGKFGMLTGCDTPTWTLEHLLHHISTTQQIDYVIWSGDSPDHEIWSQTRATQLKSEKYLMSVLVKYFPDTPVFPVLGNHEGAPVNSFPPRYIKGNDSIDWLYKQLANEWTHWVPNSTYETIRRGAFYTTLVYPGFRIVSINTNFCNSQNWWLLLNTTDPDQELKWLIDVLQQAEDSHEKVHILGHIPTGIGDCNKAWSWNYHKIINRYESTITAQFFAHTHHDHFYIFYNDTRPYNDTNADEPKRPTNVAYIGPSVTPYTNVYPGYRIYEMDGFYQGSTFAILDHTTYIANLTEANESGKLQWVKEYSAKEAYNMTSLNPTDWDELLHKMKNNTDNTLDMYIRYNSKSYKSPSACDDDCRYALLCSAQTSRSHDKAACEDLVLVT